MDSDHNETWAREFEAAARAQHGAAGQALDEHRMSNGETTWVFEGQHGQMWAICWQPGRAESNLRVWPCDRRGRPGRTQMWLHATSYADARATAGASPSCSRTRVPPTSATWLTQITSSAREYPAGRAPGQARGRTTMNARSEEIGRLLREQEQAIIAEWARAARLAGRAGQLPAPVQPSRTPQDGTEWLRPARLWLAAGVISVVLGIIFVTAGAEANSPDLNNQTPGAPEL